MERDHPTHGTAPGDVAWSYARFELPGARVARRGEELARQFADLTDTLAAMQRDQDWLQMVDRYGMPYRSLNQAVRDILSGPAGAHTGYELRTGRRLPRLRVVSAGSHLALASWVPVRGLVHRGDER